MSKLFDVLVEMRHVKDHERAGTTWPRGMTRAEIRAHKHPGQPMYHVDHDTLCRWIDAVAFSEFALLNLDSEFNKANLHAKVSMTDARAAGTRTHPL